MSMKLYDLPLSPNSRKVRAAIFELGLDVEIEVIQPREGKHKTPEFLRLNPNGKLPTLVDGEFSLWESNAILVYLASKAKRLIPDDIQGQARVHQWLYWQSSHFGPAVGKVGFERLLKPMFGLGQPDEAVVAAGTKDFENLATILNRALEGKSYLCGELTVAELAIGAFAEYGLQAGLSFDAHPHAKAWLERVMALESFKRSAPGR
jgi:glutathione S-transferase